MFFVLYSHNDEMGLASKNEFTKEEAINNKACVFPQYNAFIVTTELDNTEEGEYFIIYHHFGERVLIQNVSFSSKQSAMDYASNIESNLEAFVVKKYMD